MNALKECFAALIIPEVDLTVEGIVIYPSFDLRMSQNRFLLRGKNKSSLVKIIVKWINTKMIANQNPPVLFYIKQGKGKDSIKIF